MPKFCTIKANFTRCSKTKALFRARLILNLGHLYLLTAIIFNLDSKAYPESLTMSYTTTSTKIGLIALEFKTRKHNRVIPNR